MDLTDRLAKERRGRLAAERLLELKSRELFEANRKLSLHAKSLTGQIIEQRGEAKRLKEHTAQVTADLERAEHHVEVIERRLWDSVETITDGFAVFDSQDRLVAANSAWLSIFDYSEKIGPGTLYLELLRIAVEGPYVDLQGGEAGAWIGSMLERWDAAAPIPPQEIRTPSGEWYRFVDRRARDGDMVCLAQNITAMKRRQEELEEARYRAEAANRAKSAFLANMSHELRTPMNGVVAMADMLLEGEIEDEPRLYVSTIKSSGEALLDIINHVLDFSKMEAERMVLRPEPFDLERLLHEVVTLLGPTARDKQLSLHIDYDLFSPTHLVGDAMRIRQILINLVGNAVKFTNEGHVLIGVLCHEDGPESWAVTVTVEDTGIGIPEDMQEQIFGSFAQVESEKNRAYEGTGLGLAITRQLVELMGGEIWVESQPEQGACFGFRITLPSAEASRRRLPRVDTTIGRAMVVAPEGHEASILVRQLGQLGLEVSFAPTGSAALALAQAMPPVQLTVIDDNLSDTSAQELAQALQAANCASARLVIGRPVVRADDAGHPMPEGIDGFLTRPMLRSDLFEAIATLPSGISARKAQAGPTPVLEGAPPSSPSAEPVPHPSEADRSVTPHAVAEKPNPEPSELASPPALQFGVSETSMGESVANKGLEMPRIGQTEGPPEPSSLEPPVPLSTGPAEEDVVESLSAASAPSAQTPPPEVVAEPPLELPQSPLEAPRSMRILAAEDNKTNRFVLEKLLARLDIDLRFAMDGVEAVAMHEAFEPDLVLMDISMPRMDGKDAARSIREREANAPPGEGCHVPIVAMTAHALDGDREEILASGIDRYMTKPLKRAQLVEHIFEFCPAECRPPLVEAAVAG